MGIYLCYRNRTAEKLYGYSAEEALGQQAIELLSDVQDYAIANNIVDRVSRGESWTGQFPVKNKMGERFLAVATNTPFYDDDGTLIGIICVSSDSRPFQEIRVAMSNERQSEANASYNRSRSSSATAKLGLDPQQPIQAAIASKISNLVSTTLLYFCIYLYRMFILYSILIARSTKTGFQGEQQSSEN